MTQAELASRAGVSKPTISLLEKGQIPRVSAQVLLQVAWALGVSLDYLISGKGSPSDSEPADVAMVGA
jgi:transcriptional regulator with XRE-family HTH domain